MLHLNAQGAWSCLARISQAAFISEKKQEAVNEELHVNLQFFEKDQLITRIDFGILRNSVGAG